MSGYCPLTAHATNTTVDFNVGLLNAVDGYRNKVASLNAAQAIPGFEEIARWASFHHEIPNGEGYPFRLKGNEVPLQARLLRASDIFQALSQDRPYRSALPSRLVLGYLQKLTENGLLDRFIYQATDTHLQDIYDLARPYSA